MQGQEIKEQTIKDTVSVITYEEGKEKFSDNLEILSIINKSLNVKFCKAEVHPNYFYISFSIPDKSKFQIHTNFLCFVTKHEILFLDDSGKVGSCIKKTQKDKWVNQNSAARFLYNFLETLIEPELLYLDNLSGRMTKIENQVVNSVLDGFDHNMFALRKEILAFYGYYSQLLDIAKELQENENEFFTEKDISYFRHFGDRVEHLYNETKTLRDYTLQLRGIYQTQFDIRQNKIMKVLTIVTTICSPLTILVGWYGMNFQHMPELYWDYGYLFVFFLAIILTIMTVWILKVKNFLR